MVLSFHAGDSNRLFYLIMEYRPQTIVALCVRARVFCKYGLTFMYDGLDRVSDTRLPYTWEFVDYKYSDRRACVVPELDVLPPAAKMSRHKGQTYSKAHMQAYTYKNIIFFGNSMIMSRYLI